MGTLFTENIPAANSALQSAEIRDNFTALYDKVKALEVRASSTPNYTVNILGTDGLIYFRPSTGRQLKPSPFPGTQVDLTATAFFKTKQNPDGSLYRELQNFVGPSQYQSQGLIIQILVSLNQYNQPILTESLVGQNNRLSSAHFNLYFDDSEIPLALIFLQKNTDGSLQVINQTDIADIRPFVTSAFQNNLQNAEQEALGLDNQVRINAIEPAILTTNSFLVKLPTVAKLEADGTLLTNTLLEVISGKAWCGGNTGLTKLLKFGGCFVDFSRNPSSVSRVFSANTPALIANYWNKAIITLIYDSSSTDVTENAKVVVVHGTSNIILSSVILPSLPSNAIPLATIVYRMNSSGTDIVPFTNQQTLGSYLLNHTFPIVSLTAAPTSTSGLAYISFTLDLSQTTASASDITTLWFQVGGVIDVSDSNTPTIRRVIASNSFNPTTRLLTVTVTNNFSEISLTRTPVAKSVSQHVDLVEDLRSFVGIG